MKSTSKISDPHICHERAAIDEERQLRRTESLSIGDDRLEGKELGDLRHRPENRHSFKDILLYLSTQESFLMIKCTHHLLYVD